jgi:serine phosphatase RsbU (regulator of sigma subunit)
MSKCGKHSWLFFVLISLIFSGHIHAQKNGADSLKDLLPYVGSDTERANIYNKIALYYDRFSKYNSGLKYAFDGLKIARNTKDPLRIANMQYTISMIYGDSGGVDSGAAYGKQAETYYVAHGPKNKLLRLYKNLGLMYSSNAQYMAAVEYYTKGIEIAKELKDSIALHTCYNAVGEQYDRSGEYKLALEFYNKALNSSLQNKAYAKAVGDYVRIGTIYARQGIFASSLDAYLNALKINTTYAKNDEATAIIYVDIGNIYNGQHDTAKAMKYYKDALKLFEKMNEQDKVSILLGNIANIYMESGDYKNAEVYQVQANQRLAKIGDKEHLAISFINLGELYTKMKQYPKALEDYSTALNMEEESVDREQEAYTLSGLSTLYSLMGDNKRAIDCGLKGYEIAKSTDLIREVKDLGKILSDLYEKTNQPDKALYYYKQYISARDTMDNKEISKKMIRSELNFEYEQKQEVQKLEQEKKDALNTEKAHHERVVRNVYLGGLVIVLLLTILVFRNFMRVRNANKIITEQKTEVEQQKSIVEQKNRDITDSINYAKRIQQAMLPTIQVWNNFFKESFIYYKPKDIVSGDFYWCMPVGNDIIVVVADCTGHGVPGAFMSMLGISSLNKIVGEQGVKQPDKILNILRDEIIKSLNPEGKMEEVKDGMDMTLCYISRSNGTLEYAAANNPLWIIRKGEQGYNAIELDADKMPVGKYVEEGKTFTSHKVEIKKGDRVYLFTDGFADQFGGDKGKKFKYRHLQDMLLSCQDKNMKDQKTLLEKAMNEWKGSLEQVDDILVAGIEIV